MLKPGLALKVVSNSVNLDWMGHSRSSGSLWMQKPFSLWQTTFGRASGWTTGRCSQPLWSMQKLKWSTLHRRWESGSIGADWRRQDGFVSYQKYSQMLLVTVRLPTSMFSRVVLSDLWWGCPKTPLPGGTPARRHRPSQTSLRSHLTAPSPAWWYATFRQERSWSTEGAAPSGKPFHPSCLGYGSDDISLGGKCFDKGALKAHGSFWDDLDNMDIPILSLKHLTGIIWQCLKVKQ